MNDQNEPRSTPIILGFIVGTVALFFIGIGLLWLFNHVKQREIHAKVELAPAVDLQNMRNYEAELLGSYALLNKEQAVVRIPIERAIELESVRPWRLDARFPPQAPPLKTNDGGTTHGK